ncbi:MAG: 4-hydroxybenzoyl-CoA reductase subunit beta [Myxococcota bacterium]|jgi:4-hydroxybenzoyl-CoA reductase subunit beta
MMLPFPAFSYEAPDTLDDALALSAEEGVQIVAGGTDLLPSIKHRLFAPRALLSLRRLGLDGIEDTGVGGLHIGATATLRQVRRDHRVSARYPALAAACATVGTRTIQEMGTLGGNVMLDTRCLFYNQPAGWRDAIGGCLKADGHICHVAPRGKGCYAAHSADTIPTLWLYDAVLEFASLRGPRRVAIRDLFDEDGRSWLKVEGDELLTAIHLPPPPAEVVVHRKLRLRGAIDYGLLLVAVQRQGLGARAIISAVGPRPIAVSVAAADDLPEAARKAAQPLNTHAIATTWRKHMISVEVRRALAEA